MANVRSAREGDLEAVVDVFCACWATNYGRDLPADLSNRMTSDSARELWATAWANPTLHMVVADRGDHVVGVASFAVTDTCEGYIASLYVDPRVQGVGTGRALLAHAEQELKSLGVSRAHLWVFEANEPSIRFYRRSGWSPDGERMTLPRWGQSQIRLMKEFD